MAEELIEDIEQPQVETPQPEQPKQDIPYIKGVYANLQHAYGKDNLPDEKTFTEKMMNDNTYRTGVRDNLVHVYGKDNVPELSDFEGKLGIQKKSPVGNALPNGGLNTPLSPSTSQLPSATSGKSLIDNSAFKEFGKDIPADLQQRHDEIQNTVAKQNVSLARQKPLDRLNNAASPYLSFGKDIAFSTDPNKKVEETHAPDGHWGNIVDNVVGKMTKSIIDLAHGTLSVINDAEGAQMPVKVPTFMDDIIHGLNGDKQKVDSFLKYNELPDSFLGNTVSGLASIAPDMVLSTLAPEAKLAQGAGVLAKGASLLFNKFTNYLIAKKGVTAYGDAKEQGKSTGEATVEGLKGAATGAKEGIELALLGGGSGLATKSIMAQAEKKGLVGATALATRQLVNLSTDLVAYALVQPTVNAAEEGRFPTMKEIAQGAGIAAAFRIKGGAQELSSHSKLNKAIEETQNQRQGAAIANFVDADHDTIKQVYDSPETAQELNLQALEAAKKAKETTDLSKKHEYVAKAITLTKASNVKSVADMVLNNPQGLEDFKNSPDIPDKVKQQFLQKATEVTDLLKQKAQEQPPTENNVPEPTTTNIKYKGEDWKVTKDLGDTVEISKDNGSKIVVNKSEIPEFNETKTTEVPIPAEGKSVTDAEANKDSKGAKEESDLTVGEMLDKKGTYKGEKGTFYKDGQTVVFKVDGKNKEYELGNADELRDAPISDFDITHDESVVRVDDNGDFEVRGEPYKNNYSDPLAAINKDADGNVISVNLETKDGKKRTFRGNIAEDLAYQINLKKINENNDTRAEFERHINSDESAQKEINDGGLSESTSESAAKSDEPIPRQKITRKPTQGADKESVVEQPKVSVEPNIVDKEPEPTTNTTEETDKTGISKGRLKETYSFTKQFNEKTDQDVADSAMRGLKNKADASGISIEQQADNEVHAMKQKTGSATEQDIMTAAYHLTNLNERLAKSKDGAETDLLIKKRNDALEVLRQLGNNAGRNLRLFGNVFRKSADGALEATRAEIGRNLGVENIPKTVKELNESDMTSHDKERLKPYVEAIEKLKSDIDTVNKETEQKLGEADKKAVEDYIKAEVAKRLSKEKGNTSEAKKTLSQSGKDIADKIRKLKTPKGAAKLDFTLGTWDVAIEGIARLVEGGATIAEAIETLIKDKSIGFKTDKDKSEFENKFVQGLKKEDAIQKIAEISKGEGSITKEMVDGGLIKSVVDSNIEKDVPYEDVLPNTFKELKEHLPELTDMELRNAVLKTGEFKPETKAKLKTDLQNKNEDVKRLARTQNKLNALEAADQVSNIVNDNSLSKEEKKKAIEERKSEFEKRVDKRISDLQKQKQDAIDNDKKRKAEYKKLETERNRQLSKIDELSKKLENLQKGVRDKKTPNEPVKDTPEIEELKQKVSDANKELYNLEREANKFYGESDAGSRKIEKMQDELDRLKERREKEPSESTSKEKSKKEIDLQKQIDEERKAYNKDKREANRFYGESNKIGEKINDIDDEIARVKSEKTFFNEAIKNPKQANEALKAAKKRLDEAYNSVGIRPERGSKNEIRIAQEADKAIKEINESDLSDDVKKEHIKDIERNRDDQLNKTKQGVLINLRDNIDNHIADLKGREQTDATKEVIADLSRLRDRLNPNKENLKDQIDKANQDFDAIIKSNKGNVHETELEGISKKFVDSWQNTSDELQRQQLLDKSIADRKEIERKLAAGLYTEIPTTPYDIERDKILSHADAENKKNWQKLNALSERAQKESKDGLVDKALNARKAWIIATFGAIEKVAGSAITKPILDVANKQTAGRLSGLITGIKPTALSRVGDTFRQLKNEKSANDFMRKRNAEYVSALSNYEKVKKDFGDNAPQTKKAFTKLQSAEVDQASSLAYLFINAGSHIDIKQIMVNAATDLDASMGRYNKKYANEMNNLHKIGYWLESVNRTHGAMKSISARQGLLDGYIENLQHLQSKGEPLDINTRTKAWDMATNNEYEIGRFGEKTVASDLVGKLKSSDNAWVRRPANFLIPVAKISINIAKQGIDRAIPLEVAYKSLISNAREGMKFNAEDNIQFNNFASKYYNGIKRGFNELPLEQKKYVNTLLSRGFAGMAQYALIGYLLNSGVIKYGGAYNDNDPFHKKYGQIMGSDGHPLKNGEWEFGGHRSPKIINAIINHSPYSLPASIAADFHAQMNRSDTRGSEYIKGVQQVLNEGYQRLPFSTAIDLGKGLFGGDEYKLERTVANAVPSSKGSAEFFDKDPKTGETRDVDTYGNGFLARVGNQVKKGIPGLRNTLPTKGEKSQTLEELLQRNNTSDGLDLEKKKNHLQGDRELTIEEKEKFKQDRQAIIDANLTKLYNSSLYTKLSADEVAEATSLIKSDASNKVNKKMFGIHRKTSEEKRTLRELKFLRRLN